MPQPAALGAAALDLEAGGSWKYYFGWALLVIAAADTVALFQKERASLSPPAGALLAHVGQRERSEPRQDTERPQ